MYKNNNCPFKAKREQYAVNPPSEHFPILQATWLLSGRNFCGGKKSWRSFYLNQEQGLCD